MSKICELDYESIADLIDKNEEIIDLKSYIKKYNHSLFSPILVYSISFLNKQKDYKQYKYIIGLERLNNYKVLYTTLNPEMYNLYFLNKKKKISEINCDFSGNKQEQYKNFKTGNKLSYNKKDIINMINEDTNNIKEKENNNNEDESENEYKYEDDEEYSLQNFSFEKLCDLKHEIIISKFRSVYSQQERVIKKLKENKNYIEYPNLIFYENNKDKLHYKEIDRVLLLNQNEEFQLFKIYISIVNNEKTFYDKGSILKLKEGSLNFIEIKTSINIFEKQLSELKNKLNEKEDKKDEKKSGKSKESEKVGSFTMSKNSFLKKERTDLYYSIKNVKDFLDLYNKISIQYKEINLLYIFDSYFSMNFVEIISKLIKHEIYNKDIISTKYGNGNINLYFIHIQSDFEKIDIINREKEKDNLEYSIKDLREKLEKNEKENKDLREKNEKENKDLREKFEKENKDLRKTFEKENKDLRKKLEKNEEKFEKESKDLRKKLEKNEKESKDLKEKFEKEKKELKEKFEAYVNEKIIKNTIKNIPILDILKNEKYENFDILIGKNYHSLTIGKAINDINEIESNKNYETILDIKTFSRKLIKNNNSNFTSYETYFSKINSFKNIILLIDHDFIGNFESLKKKYMDKFEIKIIIADLSFYIAILKASESKVDKDTCSVKIIKKIIPGILEGEYEFYLDKNLVSYFKKLDQFNYNITNKINDEILIYFPENMSFQYIIKYIYIEKNKNEGFKIINAENNLLNYSCSIEDAIQKYDYKNNFYFIPIQFHDNTFEKILEYFSYILSIQIEHLKYSDLDLVISCDNNYLYQIETPKRDYFLKLIDVEQNYSPAYVKLKAITQNAGIGDSIIEAKTLKKFGRDNIRMTINLNFPSEKILFFISNIFYMKNFSEKKDILLLGDEIGQIKFYLTKIFKIELSFTHITDRPNFNFGQCFGFIEQLFKGKSTIKYMDKKKDELYNFNNELQKEIKKINILNFIESYKDLDKKYDIIFIDENFININDSLTMPSLNIFKDKMHIFEKMIKKEGIICFNLIGKRKIYYEQVKEIISKNFSILKDEKDYFNGYFILTKNPNIVNYAEEEKRNKLFKSEIDIDIGNYIKNFLSKNKRNEIEASSS